MLILASMLIAKSGPETAAVLLAIVAMLGIIIALGVLGGRLAARWDDRREAKRSAAIEAALKRLSYAPVQRGSAINVQFLSQFWVARNRKAPIIVNHFAIQPNPEASFHLLDFGSLESGGKYNIFIWQTIAVLSSPRLKLPLFVLASQKFSTVVVLPSDVPDIEFEGHRTFQKSFRLQGADEAAVRALFVPSVISELERHPQVSIEGCGSHLLLYRRRTRLKPAEWPKFEEEMRKLAQLFVPR
jgi:hypothetical protein